MEPEVPLKELLDRFEGSFAVVGRSSNTRDLRSSESGMPSPAPETSLPNVALPSVSASTHRIISDFSPPNR
jgi:hypothetical protein